MDSAKLEEFDVVVQSLTEWILGRFTSDEKASLAERLSDPTLTFASDAGTQAAAMVVEMLMS